MDIAAFGRAHRDRALERKLIDDVGDIFSLTAEQIAKIPLFKDKSITNLLDAIDASRSRPIDRLLYGFGIRHVGAAAARVLADAFGFIERIAEAPDRGALAAANGVGEVIARAVREYLRSRGDAGGARQASPRGRADVRRAEEDGGPLDRKDVRHHRHARRACRAKRRRLASRPWGEGDLGARQEDRLLVVGESPGSKLDKATKLGVAILDEAGLRGLLAG